MICMTGQEENVRDLLERLSLCSVCPMQEVRLDALKRPELPGPALPVKPGGLLIACRRTADGGRFSGSERDRIRVLDKALDRRPGWIDVEADLSEEFANPLLKRAHQEGVKVLRSLHLEEGSITRALADLDKVPGDGIKLAARVDDAALLEAFLQASRDRPAVLVGMGHAGVLSRALYSRFHSAWTYVSGTPWPDPSTALPDLQTAALWGMPIKASASLYVLLGDASITASPGPAVYNHLYREEGFDAVYLPAITRDPDRALSLLLRLGLKGASVTIPHKARAASLASRLSDDSKVTGAVNTLYVTPEDELRGANTDVEAVDILLNKLAGRPLKKGVILGRGGFAKACAFVLEKKGARVDLWGREVSREALANQEFDVLINATPDGSIPPGIDLKDKVILDGVLAASPTPLAAQALTQGARFAGGAAIWGAQGAGQLRLFGGPEVDPDRLTDLAVNLGGLAAPW